jgi:hypothetical protein
MLAIGVYSLDHEFNRNNLMEELRSGQSSQVTIDAVVKYIESLEDSIRDNSEIKKDVTQNNVISLNSEENTKLHEIDFLKKRFDELTKECVEAYKIKNQIAAENTWIYAELKNIQRSATFAVQAMESKSQAASEGNKKQLNHMSAPKGGSIEIVFCDDWASPISLWVASKPEKAKVLSFDTLKSFFIIAGLLLVTALALKAYPSLSLNFIAFMSVLAAGAGWAGVMSINFNREK